MASSNSPASNQTTIYGQIPSYVVSTPLFSISSSASSFASSTDFVTGAAGALNNVISTFVQLGWWATS